MDTITHALSGALAARVAAPKSGGAVTTADCVVLGALAAAFPDSDVVLSHLSPLAYLQHHRGVTHSVLMLPFWALLLAAVWSLLRQNRAGFRVYFLIAAIALGMHIVGDLITSFGTMIFAPLSDVRIEWGTTFIIDLWLTAIIVAGLAFSWLMRGSRLPAVLSFAVLCGYVALQAVEKHRAIAFGVAYARDAGLSGAQVSALPRPVSPFNWMVIVAERERYHYANVNLRRGAVLSADAGAGFIMKLDQPYRPLAAAEWQTVDRFGSGEERAFAEEAWRQDAFAFYRWFAAYPVVVAVERGNPSHCAWFRDLRFLTPGRESWPFRYGVCRSESEGWRAYAHPEGGRPTPVTDEPRIR